MSARLTLVVLGLLCATGQAFAKKPEDVLGGKVLLSEKTFPTQARSQQAYLAAVKKQSKDRFLENKASKAWKLHYAAFFKKAVNDLEVTMKFFDISDGQKRMVESYEQYLETRGQRVIIGTVKLKRGEGGYEPNSKILMTFESGGRVVAQAVFFLEGEGRRFTGKVEFTEEETKAQGEIPAP
jgi:hypothetical protein